MQTTYTIPDGAFLYKEGLYVYEYESNVGNLKFMSWDLYSAEGYCFYDLQQPENYDENGNLLPAEKRVYALFATMRKDEEYVSNNIISVPVEEGTETI